jgi:ubiquinone biosynthesis protein
MNLASVRERLERRRQRRRNTHRFRQIAGVAVRYGLADRLRKLPGKRMQQWLRGSAGENIAELGTPVRLRLALSELGTTFIKFGQMLSTRPDLVGEDVARELTKLQSRTPPDPPGVAEATVQQELGSPPATLFASFEPTAFASASIAQVHHARLHSGEDVVVKIQKDGIASRVEADLSMLADLASLAERHLDDLKPYHPVEIVRQFTKMMRAELDFQREQRNLEMFRQNFAADPTVHFPQPFPALCSRRVLTMERLDGVLVSQIEIPAGPGTDMNEFARRGANMYMEMIFRDAFYHADPHPGNLMLLPNGVVGVLDCGMVQRLDDQLREAIEDLLLAAVRGDPQAVTDAVWDLCTMPPTATRERLQTDITDLVAEYTGESIGSVDVGALISSLTAVIYENRLFLPPAVMLLLRMLGVLEGTAKQLNPSFGLFEVIQPHAEAAAMRRLAPRRVWGQLQRGARAWQRLLRALPGDLNDMVASMRAGTLSVHLDHRRLDPVVNRLVLGLLTSSLLLGSSLLWSLHAEPVVGGVSLLGAAGYAVACLMGINLVRNIRSSERRPEER